MRMTEQITYRLSKADKEALVNFVKENNTSIGRFIRGITKTILRVENTNTV